MHANTEQLLSLRDGEPVEAGASSHVEGCEQCRLEVDRHRLIRQILRELPAVEPPADLWRTVAVSSVASRPTARFHWASGVAIAASFVLGLALMMRIGGDGADPAKAPLETTPAATVSSLVKPGNGVSLAALQTRSQKLEALRAAMPRQPKVERAGTAMTIAELEDRIALVDLRLHAADTLGLTEAQRHALWKERVNLMQSLVQVEYSRLQAPGY
jgi:hypothetical protein